MAFIFAASQNGRGITKSNAPFTIVGNSLWAGVVHRTNSEFEQILDACENVRINAILVELWSFNSTVTYGPANVDGDLPWTNNVSGGSYTGVRGTADMQTPNNTYWAKVKTRLQQIEDRGMMIFAGVSPYGFYGANQGILSEILLSSNDVTAHEDFADYLANGNGGSFTGLKSLQNLTIFLGSDAGTNNSSFVSSGDSGTAATRQIAFMQEMKAQGLSCLMGFNGQAPTNSTDEDPFDAETSFNPVYTYGGTYPTSTPSESSVRTYAQARRAYNFTPTVATQSRDGNTTPTAIPAFLFETVYKNSLVEPTAGGDADVRKAQFWAVLSGATAGVFWGHEDLYALNGSLSSLLALLDDSSAHDLQYFAEMVAGLSAPLYSLVPSELNGMRKLIGGSRGSQSGSPTDYIAAACDSVGKAMLVYVPPNGSGTQTFDVDMRSMATTSRARWWNPASGGYTDASGGFTISNSLSARSFTTPGSNGDSNDWFLVFDTGDTGQGKFWG